jgi:hypothetical protein
MTKQRRTKMKIYTEVHGLTRTIWIDGQKYEIMVRSDIANYDKEDKYRYFLPNGRSYTHPTEFGALLMIIKHHAGGEWDSKAKGE